MAVPFFAPRARATLGVLLICAALGVAVLRARAVSTQLAIRTDVMRLHEEGRASEKALANAVYHGAHAQRSYETRWTLTGYATHGVLGSAAGLALLLARRRRGAA